MTTPSPTAWTLVGGRALSARLPPDRCSLKRAAADPQSPKQGRPAAVIVGHEEYESLIETLNILADSDTVTAIAEAEADLAAGDLVPLD